MPNKTIEDLIRRVAKLEIRLDINTMLTGFILVALLGNMFVQWLKK